MSYSVNLTDGTPLVTVQDGLLNTTYSATLVGKGYADYATAFASNSIHQLENYASTVPPINPLQGQLWYNKGNRTLYVYTAGGFQAITNNIISSNVTTLSAGVFNAGTATIASLSGGSISFNTASIKNLTVTENFIFTKAQIANVSTAQSNSGNYSGPIGITLPNVGKFTSVTATNVQATNMTGNFNGIIGANVANAAKFTQVTATQINGGSYYGNVTGSINQQGMRYPGSFTSLVADNLQVNGNFGAAVLTATQGLVGTLRTANQPQITSVGTLANLTVQNFVTAATVNAQNISGLLTSGTQPNITMIGTLGHLDVTNDVQVGGKITATQLQAVNIAGKLTTGAQPNITSVGILANLSVSGQIIGNVTGTASLALNSQHANQADTVRQSTQSLIMNLPSLTDIRVRGNVDLGPATSIAISGGNPGALLGLGNNNRLTWLNPAVLPDQTNNAYKVLSTNGTVPQWIDAPIPASVADLVYNYNTVGQSQTTIDFLAGEDAYTAHTVLTIENFDYFSATIWMSFSVYGTGEIYSGLITISHAGGNKYRVINAGFAGGDNNYLQISCQDRLGDVLPSRANYAASIEIKFWNTDVLDGKTRSAATVQYVSWHWVTRVNDYIQIN